MFVPNSKLTYFSIHEGNWRRSSMTKLNHSFISAQRSKMEELEEFPHLTVTLFSVGRLVVYNPDKEFHKFVPHFLLLGQ
jgi:uncharacterized protein YlzI (FlbEa/FlbD family)